ncbi:MAG: CPBP family glutamic-type intramembrane protease [Chlamydiota bacterium]
MAVTGIEGTEIPATFAGQDLLATLKVPTPKHQLTSLSTESLKGRVESRNLDSYEILKISGQQPRANVALGVTVGLVAGSCLSKDIRLGSFVTLSEFLITFLCAAGVIYLKNPNVTSNLDVQKDTKERYLEAQSKATQVSYRTDSTVSLIRTLVGPLEEEVQYRWLMQGVFLPIIIDALGLTPPSYTPAIAIGVAAAAFGAMHLSSGRGSEMPALQATIGGVVYGILYNKAGLTGTVAAHCSWNTICEGVQISCRVLQADIINSKVNGLTDILPMDKVSIENREKNLITLGNSVVSDPDDFILLLMVIIFNKSLLKEEKQKLLSLMTELLPKDSEVRSIAKNMLHERIYEFVKEDAGAVALIKSSFKDFGLPVFKSLVTYIESRILVNSGLKKEEIEEITWLALKKRGE